MQCQKLNCERESECAIALNVPALGMPIAEHDPLQVIVGLELCREHAADEEVESWIVLPQYQELFERAAKGLAPPDFGRAFTTIVEFDSDEWRQLAKAKEAKKHQVRAGQVVAKDGKWYRVWERQTFGDGGYALCWNRQDSLAIIPEEELTPVSAEEMLAEKKNRQDSQD